MGASLADRMGASLIAVPAEGTSLDAVAAYLANEWFRREEIEDALGLLVAADVLSVEGQRVVRLPAADRLEALSDRRRQAEFEAIATRHVDAEPLPLDPAVWSAAEKESRRQKTRHRLEVVEAVLWAAEHPHEVLEAVASSPDRPAARASVQALGWTEFQAEHILDMTFSRATTSSLAAMREERTALVRQCEELD